MATVFEIFIAHPERDYAEQAAWEAFAELDRLECELSRFIESSDISRINALAPNQPLIIGLDAFVCLQQCERLARETFGTFDITIGPLWQCWFDQDKKPRTPSKQELDQALLHTGFHLIELDVNHRTVQVERSVQIDLGGMGKGYAVDKMGELLRDWTIDSALIHGGRSSVLALDAPPNSEGWPLTIRDPASLKPLESIVLKNRAIGVSGLRKGAHIIDPRTGEPTQSWRAAWSFTSSAATADALSTAFMVMSEDEIKRYCKKHPGTQAIVLRADGEASEPEIFRMGI